MRLELISHSPEETQAVGELLGKAAQAGDLFLLQGAFGAGKTVLTQGIARGLGVPDAVTSPSYIIVNEYQGRLPLYHVDLYRLESPAEVLDLGLEDYLLYGEGVCVVEWADRALDLLPKEGLLVTLTYMDENRRRLSFSAQGESTQRLLAALSGQARRAGHD